MPRDAAADGLGVRRRQRRRRPEAGRDLRFFAAARVVAGVDMNQVGAGRADVLLHALLRAVAERHHRHHRRDADDHPEHGQDGAQLVAIEAPDGEADAGEQHRYSSVPREALVGADPRSAPADASGYSDAYSYRSDWIGSRPRGLLRRIPTEEDADRRRDADRRARTADGEIVVDQRR